MLLAASLPSRSRSPFSMSPLDGRPRFGFRGGRAGGMRFGIVTMRARRERRLGAAWAAAAP